MVVRLQDPNWPASAQMLIIGKIVRVEPKPTEPLRQVITVRPVYDLSRLGEVVVRIPEPGAQVIPAPASADASLSNGGGKP